MPTVIPAWCLAVVTIAGEAGVEPYEGKVAVARVIRNRMRLKYNSDGTLPGTVLRAYQFSFWNTDTVARPYVCQSDLDSGGMRDAQLAWFESAASDDGFADVVLYHADYVKPTWVPKVRFVRQIGRHLFYADK